MKSISLDGSWKLYYGPQGNGGPDHPDQLSSIPMKGTDAIVPGNVELDLLRGGEIRDPFYGDNIHDLKKYETYQWWYQRSFETPSHIGDQRVELVFHGVDCIAVYWLNGKELGRSDNMFIEHRFDVTHLLNREGTNTLTVRLDSPILEAMKKKYDPSQVAMATNWEQLWIRKAPHSYGWDIMPRVVSAGLWRSVELVVHGDYEIEDVYFYTRSLEENRAKVGVFYEVQLPPGELNHVDIMIEGTFQGRLAFTYKQRLRFTAGTLEMDISDPKLWWPRGYGEAHLYQVTTRILHGEKVLASREDTMGIRTVDLIRTDVTSIERPGEFLFKVNGTPILCKGSNWVPADAFHSRDAERYEKMLALFKDLNCNILRCWGGNVYEDHEFFDLCDRYGIMVWQDFAMACAAYPQTEDFLEKIREEAVSVVRKLRNHPSIILWSGDNECDYSYINRGLDPAENRITREVLHQVVFQCDPYRQYLPSSPYHSPEVIQRQNTKLMPEDHLWGPRDYYKSRYYTESPAHFVSEIGYHGCPNISSIKAFISPENLWPWENNREWITHCTDTIGENGPFSYRIKLMADQIKEMFGYQPDNLEDFVLSSQISQAEAKKFFIEMTRLKKWRRTGIIWWNVIDGWPQFSDAVVDYYFGKKLAYYYIKRVQQPVCIMMDEPRDWHCRVVVGNDSCEDARGDYRIWDGDTMELLMEGSFSAPKNENKEIGQIRVSHGEQKLFLMEWTVNGRTYGNHYLLGHPPFSLPRYKEWLEKIAALQDEFSYQDIGK